jgi:uncharacterized membrane protein/thiol-disulfide isomerase/thioredoxin
MVLPRSGVLLLLLGIGMFAALLLVPPVQAQQASNDDAIVRAVLFYSPTCPHCHQVINEDLPPLFEQYGEQLQVMYIDVTQTGGQAVYLEAIEQFDVSQQGVPMLIIGDTVLLGGMQIPQQLPVLIEQHLTAGGVDWPALPTLHETIDAAEEQSRSTARPTTSPTTTTTAPTAGSPAAPTPATSPAPTDTPAAAAALPDGSDGTGDSGQAPADDTIFTTDAPATRLSIGERVARDPTGNGLAIVVLAAMVLAVGSIGATFTTQPAPTTLPAWHAWAIPLLCLIGGGVAGYLAYVETSNVAAVCGPVGDCNTVQQSEYARLFGILPVGVLGMVGYVLMLFAWLAGHYGSGTTAARAWLALFAMALLGTLFSIYLTFLEPFVIGASCAWCLTSSVVMTALLWLSHAPAKRAWQQRQV